jgi:hypothetical protein
MSRHSEEVLRARGRARVKPPERKGFSRLGLANVRLAYQDRQLLAGEVERLEAALAPLVAAARQRYDDHKIPDSDLDDEQPVSISLTLGDLRRASRLDPWNRDMRFAPRTEPVIVMGRWADATAGFPRMACWWPAAPGRPEGWYDLGRGQESFAYGPLVVWAWRPRPQFPWPSEVVTW